MRLALAGQSKRRLTHLIYRNYQALPDRCHSSSISVDCSRTIEVSRQDAQAEKEGWM